MSAPWSRATRAPRFNEAWPAWETIRRISSRKALGSSRPQGRSCRRRIRRRSGQGPPERDRIAGRRRRRCHGQGSDRARAGTETGSTRWTGRSGRNPGAGDRSRLRTRHDCVQGGHGHRSARRRRHLVSCGICTARQRPIPLRRPPSPCGRTRRPRNARTDHGRRECRDTTRARRLHARPPTLNHPATLYHLPRSKPCMSTS